MDYIANSHLALYKGLCPLHTPLQLNTHTQTPILQHGSAWGRLCSGAAIPSSVSSSSGTTGNTCHGGVTKHHSSPKQACGSTRNTQHTARTSQLLQLHWTMPQPLVGQPKVEKLPVKPQHRVFSALEELNWKGFSLQRYLAAFAELANDINKTAFPQKVPHSFTLIFEHSLQFPWGCQGWGQQRQATAASKWSNPIIFLSQNYSQQFSQAFTLFPNRKTLGIQQQFRAFPSQLPSSQKQPFAFQALLKKKLSGYSAIQRGGHQTVEEGRGLIECLDSQVIGA